MWPIHCRNCTIYVLPSPQSSFPAFLLAGILPLATTRFAAILARATRYRSQHHIRATTLVSRAHQHINFRITCFETSGKFSRSDPLGEAAEQISRSLRPPFNSSRPIWAWSVHTRSRSRSSFESRHLLYDTHGLVARASPPYMLLSQDSI